MVLHILVRWSRLPSAAALRSLFVVAGFAGMVCASTTMRVVLGPLYTKLSPRTAGTDAFPRHPCHATLVAVSFIAVNRLGHCARRAQGVVIAWRAKA